MPRLKSFEDLQTLQAQAKQNLALRRESGPRIVVGMGTCGIAAGARETMDAILAELARRHVEAEVTTVGCIGICSREPLVDLEQPGQPPVTYSNVSPAMVPRLIEEHLLQGRPVQEWTSESLPADPASSQTPLYRKQLRVILRNCGVIDPENIDQYIARDGYQALGKVLTGMQPAEVYEEVKLSRLRGRGGAGFLTGLKWEFTARASSEVKYVVCNADEGDPGAFMDRSVIEGDPHSLLEGMTICGYAIGAREGYVYCRAEYPLAIKRLEIAIAQAVERGLLGDDILGTGFSFHLHIKEGAGAFVCGEETALLASIEGKRGEPRPRPPYPAVVGLWGKPTNLNNVKSYASVPQIMLHGAEWFATIGSPKSPGTAIFALTGKVNNTGLIEVPMGITLGEIIFDIGGGIPNGKPFKAVQTGGPLGGCIPAQHLNVPVDFDSLKEVGAVMGSGGMIVVDEDTCMVEFAKFFLQFATAESCGKCVPCRVGGKRMLEVLTRITEGHGRLEDLETIRDLAIGMETASLCALGQLTPGPVKAALQYFEDEFLAHIVDKRCPAGTCKALVRARCTNACPADVDVPSYVALVAQGRYAEGLEIHRRTNPFPLACGRVCPAFCEDRCRRADIDQAIAIRAAKRFMADHELEHPWTPPLLAAPKEQRVAVVGAGPAGLTAALRLAQQGYEVDVFEKLPVPGGMMAVGIPDYRLPRPILQAEIDAVRRAGVQIYCNQALGRDFTLDSLLTSPQPSPEGGGGEAPPLLEGGTEGGWSGYSAVVLAIGAHRGGQLRIEGEDLPGVLPGVDLLREVALGNPPDLAGKRVGVVGGGNVAIDAARTAWRLDAAEVHVIYRRRREEMPAYKEEIEAAQVEGIRFHYLTNPTRILGNGRVQGIECLAHDLGEFDRSARRRPVPIAGSEFVIDLDVLIPAIGQSPDLDGLEDEVEVQRDQTFVVDEALCTSRPGVFAAGDAVLGPATVVEAVAQGNQVARVVDHYLRSGQVARPVIVPGYDVVNQPFSLDDYATARRPQVPALPPAQRRDGFPEVELGLDESAAREECKRCLRCDLEWLQELDLAFAPVPERIESRG